MEKCHKGWKQKNVLDYVEFGISRKKQHSCSTEWVSSNNNSVTTNPYITYYLPVTILSALYKLVHSLCRTTFEIGKMISRLQMNKQGPTEVNNLSKVIYY